MCRVGSPWFAALVVVWALSDVVRYPYYLLTTINVTNKPMEWLRYSAFIVLYPMYVKRVSCFNPAALMAGRVTLLPCAPCDCRALPVAAASLLSLESSCRLCILSQ